MIREYSGYVMAVVSHTAGASLRMQDREELVADTFVALWQKAPTLRPNSNLKPWLAVVSRNATLNYIRAMREAGALYEWLHLSDDTPISQPLEQEERAAMLRAAMEETLRDDDRSFFTQHYFEEKSILTISRETGMNESTIKSRLLRGRRALKNDLTQKGMDS